MGAACLLAGSSTAYAQDSGYAFAGTFNTDGQTVYISNRVQPVTNNPYRNTQAERDLKEAFTRAVRQQTGTEEYKLHGQFLGPPGRRADSGDSEDARLSMIEQWRRDGKQVVVIHW
ncbi:hypothetical protein D3C72_405560 [compost metagenome]